MSSARIHAHKGAIEVLASSAAASRASHAGDPGVDATGGFAAALGALAGHGPAQSHHGLHGSDDLTAGDDQTDAQAAADADPVTAGVSAASVDAADAPSLATLPGLTGWFTASGDQAAIGTALPAGQRGPAKHGTTTAGAAATPGAAAMSAAAAAIAASLLAPVPAAASTAAVSSGVVGSATLGHGVPAATRPAIEALAAAPVGSMTGTAEIALRGDRSYATPLGAPPGDAANSDAGPTPDATALGAPDNAPDAGLQPPAAPGSPASVAAIDMPAAPLIQAAASPAPTPPIDAAVLAAAASAVGAIANPVAASAGGSGAHDFADTARDGQAAAAAASGGVAAAGNATDTAGGIGAPAVGAGTASGPSLGADPGAANVANQLSGQMLRLLANSGHEALVRLHPPDLGEVTVRVAVSGRDVSAWFGSPQPDVQQSISAGLGQLQTDLGNAGYNLNNAWVGADTSGSGARGNAPPQPAPIAMPASAAPVTPVAASRPSNSGVSIYV